TSKVSPLPDTRPSSFLRIAALAGAMRHDDDKTITGLMKPEFQPHSIRRKRMRLIDRTPKVDRRSFLASTGAAALVVTSTSVLCPTESWGVEAQNLKPETVRTLIRMSRD